MPTIAVEVTEEVGQALARQARALLLGRRQYVRSLLAAVASEVERTAEEDRLAVERETKKGAGYGQPAA